MNVIRNSRRIIHHRNIFPGSFRVAGGADSGKLLLVRTIIVLPNHSSNQSSNQLFNLKNSMSVQSIRNRSNIPSGGSGDQNRSHDHSHDGNGVDGIDQVQTTIQKHNHESNHDHVHSHDHGHNDHDHSHDEHDHSHGGLSMLSHTHTHKEPNELLSSSISNPAVRITWIGLIVNVGMAISKGIGGVYFHSQSLIADAIHSVSDMVADFLTLATVNVATKVGNPDNFPLGYGKIESVGSLLVSGVLLFAGISVGWSSLLQVFEYTLPGYIYEYASKIQIGHSHSHGNLSFGSEPVADQVNGHNHEHSHSHGPESQLTNSSIGDTANTQIPNINAAWLAGASIIVKEVLFQKTMKVADQMNSKVLVANAWHHRIDSLTALVAVVTVTGGVMFNIAWLDSIGGLLVSGLIIKAGWGSFRTAILELIDKGEAKTTEESTKIKDLVQDNLSTDAFKILNLSILTSGANSNIFLTLVGSDASNESIKELNILEDKISNAIRSNDKFVRNVFIQFKKIDDMKYNQLTDKDINETMN